MCGLSYRASLKARRISSNTYGNSLYFDPLHFVEGKLLFGEIVKLGRSGRFVIGDALGVLQRPAVFKIGGNAGGAKGMAAGRVGQGGGLRPALDHVEPRRIWIWPLRQAARPCPRCGTMALSYRG